MGGGGFSEEELWRRVRSGEDAVVGEIFDLHRDRVFRHAYRLLRSVADAEDGSAVAFLELWRKRAHVRVVEGSVLPWLLATTTNACRNLERSRRRYQRLLSSLPHGLDVESAEEAAMSRFDIDPVLASALTALPASDAQLLALVGIEGYSLAEAATALGMTSGAARTRLYRTRTAVRRTLGHDSLGAYLAEVTSS